MDEMQEMLEHYRITKLVADYCRGVDRADWDLMESVYAQESWDDHGTLRMDGRAFVAELMGRQTTRPYKFGHHLNQTVVHLDGDTAGAETYFHSIVVRDDDEGNTLLDLLWGRYVDHLSREPGGKWRINKRQTIRDWSMTTPVTEDRIGAMAFLQGQPNQSDPSYTALGRQHSGRPVLQWTPVPNDR